MNKRKFERRVIGVAYFNSTPTEEQILSIKRKLFKKLTASSMITVRGEGNMGLVLLFIDSYSPESLSIPKYLFHLLRKLGTAIFGNIGIKTFIVII